MKVSHYFEFEDHVTGGIHESVVHQRKMLDRGDRVHDRGDTRRRRAPLQPDGAALRLVREARERPRDSRGRAHPRHRGGLRRQLPLYQRARAKPLKPYLSRAYRLADALVCPSEYNRGVIEEYTDTPTTVISNGVDREKLAGFESLEDEYRERYDLCPRRPSSSSGHVIKRKGLETFVDLARELPDIDFAWFGPLDLSLKAARPPGSSRSRQRTARSPGSSTTFGARSPPATCSCSRPTRRTRGSRYWRR